MCKLNQTQIVYGLLNSALLFTCVPVFSSVF